MANLRIVAALGQIPSRSPSQSTVFGGCSHIFLVFQLYFQLGSDLGGGLGVAYPEEARSSGN